jgi:hypothetical protein
VSDASPVFLQNTATGDVVPAELVCGIELDHLIDWHRAWQPALGAIKATLRDQGVPRSQWPQSSHWNWPEKVEEGGALLGFETYCITAEGMTQAMMRVDLATKASRVQGSEGKPLVYIDYLEVAPWNQSFVGMPRRFRGAGTILLTAAAVLSVEQDFKGRLGLHALPQSESFYEKSGMIDFGPDPKVQNLRYYEMTADAAHALTARE